MLSQPSPSASFVGPFRLGPEAEPSGNGGFLVPLLRFSLRETLLLRAPLSCPVTGVPKRPHVLQCLISTQCFVGTCVAAIGSALGRAGEPRP